MKKNLILVLALLGLAFQTTSCKSKKTHDDTEIVENADVEKIEAEDSALATQQDNANVGPIDESLQAALGEGSTTPDPTLNATDNAVTESVNSTANQDIVAAPTLDESTVTAPPPEITETPVTTSTQSTTAAATDPVASSTVDASTTAMNLNDTGITETPVTADGARYEQVANDTASTVAPTETTPAEQPVKKMASSSSSGSSSGGGALRKIADSTPYQHGNGWVNTVYIARPKEKLKDISQKIYGQDKSKDLKKINSFLASRAPKGGDKIYYISPNRPTDSSKMISYYEDNGMIPETYVAKKGDNLRKVAKNLLGYDNAYKEIWTTNTVASKSVLPEGETLKYWKSVGSVGTVVAQNTGGAQVIDSANQLPGKPVNMPPPPPPQEVAAHTPPPPSELPPPAELPPPPPVPDQNAQLPPPPPDMNAQAATPPPPPAELPPPPPTPDQVAAMTPPPPPTAEMAPEAPKKKVTPAMEEEAPSQGFLGSDTMAMLGGVVVLCALLAFALIRRNKKKKEAEFQTMMNEETNVGT